MKLTDRTKQLQGISNTGQKIPQHECGKYHTLAKLQILYTKLHAVYQMLYKHKLMLSLTTCEL